ncbi:MAG: hypothetical protein EAZ89_06135 [Bacteroidetes bacterium]|nr:MAG: hypothetical protein EAZ89_06135 [Bacteroidota bacterium]
MMRNLLFISPLLLLFGCDGFFGRKTDTEFLDVPVADSRPVAYVPIQPAWDGLSSPGDVIAGWDELIYVADRGTEEIISFDQAGNELGRFAVPGLYAIAQDRSLDILATGTRDTLISGTTFTLPAIYRIDLNKSGDYGLAQARITKVVVHPFYFRSSTPTSSDVAVRFTSIAPLADNSYYVSRTGPSNGSNQFGGPDDAVLTFNSSDTYISPVSISTNLGLFRDYIRQPSAVVSYAQPPQSPAVNSRGDFYFASLTSSAQLKVQSIRLEETAFGASFVAVNLPAGDTSKADGFLYTPNRFRQPSDVTLSGDGSNYLFVTDIATDSLYQFNALGYEGVNPPAGATSRKAIRVSFGGTGEGLTQFRDPSGVAWLNKIIYVADAGNGRILRFKLTTDFD